MLTFTDSPPCARSARASHLADDGVIVHKEGEYEVARFADGTIRWAFANTAPGFAWVSTGSVAPLNQWTHVSVTYDQGTVKTYANGSLVHTYNGAGEIGDALPAQNDLRIGGRQLASHNFHGRIDEVRVYSRALTASEVGALANTAAAVEAMVSGHSWLVTDQFGTPACGGREWKSGGGEAA